MDLARARTALLGADHVVPHTDADGLSAGALALRARGEPAAAAVLLARGQTPWSAQAPLPRGRLAILDWGVRAPSPPGLIVDHHLAEVAPGSLGSEVAVLSDPGAPTAALVRRIAPEQPAWLAAVGAVGDLGDAGFSLLECADAPKTAVRRLVPLVNAPRRVLDGPVRTALELLVEHDDPKSALQDARVALLEAARSEWRAELARVIRAAPVVGETVALLRFRSSSQVHPLVATTWARRLAPRMVIAANDDYLPGRVNFAVRGGAAGEDLRQRLRLGLPDVSREFAHGHARATGGSLDPHDFERLLRGLGISDVRGR